jgi:hypothetical protein
MCVIKRTEVFMGSINNSLERSLQNLMHLAFNEHSTTLKYVSAHWEDIPSAQDGKEWA